MADKAAEGAAEGSWETRDNVRVRPKGEGTGNQGKNDMQKKNTFHRTVRKLEKVPTGGPWAC